MISGKRFEIGQMEVERREEEFLYLLNLKPETPIFIGSWNRILILQRLVEGYRVWQKLLICFVSRIMLCFGQ